LDRQAAEDRIRAALRRDDPAACELLWDRYAGDLLARLQALLGSKHDAEDVLQTVFVRMVCKRRHLAQARCLEAYVHQIAHHEAVSFLRRRRKSGPHLGAEPWLVPAPADDGPRELAEELQTVLARLPQTQREVIVLKVHRDKTFREIATLLELPLNTVASRYRYGLEKLRTLLKDFTP